MKVTNKNQINKANLNNNIELIVESINFIGSKTTVSIGRTRSDELGKTIYLKKFYVNGEFDSVKYYRTLAKLKASIKTIKHY